VFFASFGFKDSRTAGWYQQWFPNMNGSTIASMTFLDSLTGFAVTGTSSTNQCYILKTSNGGDNWNIIYTYNSGANIHFTKIQFANNSIGYASTNFYNFYKTTDAGLNWIQLSTLDGAEDMAVINTDTILVVTSDGFAGGVFRSTNGGLNWQALGPTGGSGQPYNIYMFNKDIGFNLGSAAMKKTTNGGVNWFVITGEGYASIKFIDSSKGWKTAGSNIISTTTNGGLNWIAQQLPNIHHAYSGTGLSIINKDTVWMIGNEYYFGLLYKTTNGGNNWGYQIADTSIHETFGYFISFINNKIGWALSSLDLNTEIHTLTGGNDSTFFTSINNTITSIPKDYILYQNYPNPFNPMTNVKVQMLKQGFAEIKVFDMSGKLIKVLIKQNLSSGEHKIVFDASDLTSGVYFYILFVDGNRIDTKKAILIK